MKMKIKLRLLGLFVFSQLSWAGLESSFPPGKGSTFNLIMKDSRANLSIYIAEAKTNLVSIEYFMEVKDSLLPIQMWQQFEIQVNPGKLAQITKGFVQTKELKQPETMTSDYLQGFDGVQVNDFLFNTKEELDKNKVAVEEVSVPAGKTKATHYRTKNNDQTVDYWISDEAKPIGLVKLVSTNPKKIDQEYTIELVSLMKNVKPYIVPQNAVPLTELGKSFLAKPNSIR